MKRLSSRIFAFVLAFMMCIVLMPLGTTQVKASGMDYSYLDFNNAPDATAKDGVTVEIKCTKDSSHSKTYHYQLTKDEINKVDTGELYYGTNYPYYLKYVKLDISDSVKNYQDEFDAASKLTHKVVGYKKTDEEIPTSVWIDLVSQDGSTWKQLQPYEIDVTCANISSVDDAIKDLKLKYQVICMVNSKHSQTEAKPLLTEDGKKYYSYSISATTADDGKHNIDRANVIIDTGTILQEYNDSNKTSTHYIFERPMISLTFDEATDTAWKVDTTQSSALENNIAKIKVYGCGAPAAPGDSELKNIFDDKITVGCTTDSAHKVKKYDLLDKSYTLGTVVGSGTYTTEYTVPITIKDDYYIAQYNKDTGKTHDLAVNDSASKTYTLKYNMNNGEWEFGGTTYPSFNVKCNNTKQVMYRLYNKNSGEHFYTGDVNEKDYLASIGWKYEGIGWTAPATSKTPVYRLYNKNGGEHHYTESAAERDMLVSKGWKYESIGWYSDDAKGTPVYRQFNKNQFSNNHNYTADEKEKKHLISIGWKDEGIGWYGIKE
ncbi:MAG: hypothetical protein LKE64_06220 [Solobacterium sp.]|jgi:hypothetical protein|nr:hypothetical protein [Solobacterium sp.]MCH4049179.1 hypothetical protein [Solobacterium sp.]MCH4074067.1 hypothetical protein [Solobacterium sp.]MCI1313329.1 hypothetical protein [Solobacterium sp.]MCI1346172.1 hypothetical protein [Solobacterium sp.]